MTQFEMIRIECIKAAVRVNPTVPVRIYDIIERAKAFEKYVKTGDNPAIA